MDDYSDADLAKAIALSLQESAPLQPPHEKEYIYISDDDDDHAGDERKFQVDLQRAMEASKQDASRGAFSSATDNHVSAAGANAFLSERAQMEKERLARQKRLRPDLDTDADEEGGRSTKRQHLSSSSSAVRTTNAGASYSSACDSVVVLSESRISKGKSGEELFWDGELRQTANMHVDPAKDTCPTFRLSNVFAPRDEIALAIVSSYAISFPWLYSFFNPSTPVIVVAQDPQGQETIKAVLPHWVKTTPFLRNGMGCMHMKFMLLFYKSGRLRIVISTANLIELDWRDIENTVWLQDLPARSSPIAHDPKAEDFATAMIRVLRAVNVAPALISQLRNGHPNLPMQRLEDLRTHWDFSKIKVHLVPSIAGKHEGWPKVILAGHTALMKVLKDMGATPEKGREMTLECQGSSIGTYSTQWMNEFYCSARGESAQPWLDQSKARRAKLPYPPVKILFPTLRTVRESALGEPGGGTMFCRRNQWAAAKFPRELFHQSKSKRGKVLMHTKMILATFRKPSINLHRSAGSSREDSEMENEENGSDFEQSVQTKLAGWVYVGSHNFTPSAWGTLSGSAFNPTLNITNYELGIVMPLKSGKDADRIACWERPSKKYILGKDEPWIQAESPAFAEG